jgi:hypothetical protein
LQLALYQFHVNTGIDPYHYPELIDCFEDEVSFAAKQACAVEMFENMIEQGIQQIPTPPNALSLANPACARMFNFRNSPPSRFFNAGITNVPVTFNLTSGPITLQINNLFFESESLNTCPFQLSDIAAQAINSAITETTRLVNAGIFTPTQIADCGPNTTCLSRTVFLAQVNIQFRALVRLCAPANGRLVSGVWYMSDGRAGDWQNMGIQFTDLQTFGTCP